jgi:hypothetical protein
MTAEQAATLKRLAEAAYDHAAFKLNLTRAEAEQRIAILTAKLKLLDGPPHKTCTGISRKSQRGNQRPSCSAKMKRGGRAVLKRCFILQLSFVLNPIITASLAD